MVHSRRGEEGAAVATHPELEAEQAHVDRAYERLDQLRSDTAELLRSVLDQGRGGTHQFREERDVIVRTSLARLDQLDIGEQALCFGRIDRRDGAEARNGAGEPRSTESFHIGRLGVSGDDLEPLVVDWRAPVAEPFYRATGRDPMGLVLRRHLAAQGRRIAGIEDEWFGRAAGANGEAGAVHSNGHGPATGAAGAGPAFDNDGGDGDAALELGGPGALLAALEGARTGTMRDIVATIQREQDEIIRSALPGVMVVQGGPGTGKTAVALHRAAYLLYTHRFPLERQGVLVIGPNPLFLRYIEHVLPSLGESGVTLSTIEGLVHGVTGQGRGRRRRGPAQGRGPHGRPRGAGPCAAGSARCATTLDVPFGAAVLRLDVDSLGRRRGRRPPPPRHPQRPTALRRAARRPAVGGRLPAHPGIARVTPGASPVSAEDWLEDAATSDRPTPTAVTDVAALDPESAGDAALDPESAGDADDGADAVAGVLPGFEEFAVAAGAAAHDDEPDHPHMNGHSAPGRPPVGRPQATDDDDPESGFDLAEFSRSVRRMPEVVEALDRMWPRLSAEEMLHDLFGSAPLLALAGKGLLTAAEQASLLRERSTALAEIPWTVADLALIDEARVLLGPRRGRTAGDHDDGPRTYGHIVVDEAQDLSPMQLRSVARRSLSGSITVVGDIGQATGPWAPERWDQVTAHLPAQRPARNWSS